MLELKENAPNVLTFKFAPATCLHLLGGPDWPPFQASTLMAMYQIPCLSCLKPNSRSEPSSELVYFDNMFTLGIDYSSLPSLTTPSLFLAHRVPTVSHHTYKISSKLLVPWYMTRNVSLMPSLQENICTVDIKLWQLTHLIANIPLEGVFYMTPWSWQNHEYSKMRVVFGVATSSLTSSWMPYQ